jgi:hypothetical protein
MTNKVKSKLRVAVEVAAQFLAAGAAIALVQHFFK